ncbi:spondin-2-like [Asterias amurensis]|uniref:spondin-2-like n=1 Tax=Asterias amurensis TaxID=7602 RepID=UPI003AB222A5
MAQKNRTQLGMFSLLLVVGSFLVGDVSAACGGEETASYRLEFQGLWSESRFPKSFPKYRKNAQWSTLTGVTHDDRFRMWEPRRLAGQAFRNFVEGEDPSGTKLHGEMTRNTSVHAIFAAKSIPTGTGASLATASLSRDFTKISFAVHLIPSPDWFVGVSNLDLCEGGTWRKQPLDLYLQPWDAGTDGGFSFTSPDYVSNPQEPISQITAHYPDHPANSFFYPQQEALSPIARVTLTWKEVDDTNVWIRDLQADGNGGRVGSTVETNVKEHKYVFPPIPDTEIVVPYDCQVKSWGAWSPCSTVWCKVSVKQRYRMVIEKPRNGGADCPSLMGLQACENPVGKAQKKCLKTRFKKETKKYMNKMRRNYMGKKRRNKFIV